MNTETVDVPEIFAVMPNDIPAAYIEKIVEGVFFDTSKCKPIFWYEKIEKTFESNKAVWKKLGQQQMIRRSQLLITPSGLWCELTFVRLGHEKSHKDSPTFFGPIFQVKTADEVFRILSQESPSLATEFFADRIQTA